MRHWLRYETCIFSPQRRYSLMYRQSHWISVRPRRLSFHLSIKKGDMRCDALSEMALQFNALRQATKIASSSTSFSGRRRQVLFEFAQRSTIERTGSDTARSIKGSSFLPMSTTRLSLERTRSPLAQRVPIKMEQVSANESSMVQAIFYNGK